MLGGKQDHRRLFQDTPVDPRQVASTVAMSAFIEVAREWVQSALVHSWLARVLEDLGGEHPVPALPSCGLCDAFVLVLLESLPNLDSTLCKSKCVALHAWLYNLLGGAAEKLVTPPSKGNDATRSLLSAATTGCKRFCKLAISRQKAEVNRATSAAARERTTATRSIWRPCTCTRCSHRSLSPGTGPAHIRNRTTWQ